LSNEKQFARKITDLSLRELIALTQYLNKVFKYSPIIIGGWAVWHYTKGLGSRDIDIVMPSKESIENYLGYYCRTHGFKRTSAKIRKNYRKEITVGKRIEKIELDVFTFKDKNTLNEDNKCSIPWKFAEDYSKEWFIEGKATARVPAAELLILLKMFAFRGRVFKLAHSLNITEMNRKRMETKIWKDKNDIKGLLKQKLDEELLNELLKKTKFKKYYADTLKEIERE